MKIKKSIISNEEIIKVLDKAEEIYRIQIENRTNSGLCVPLTSAIIFYYSNNEDLRHNDNISVIDYIPCFKREFFWELMPDETDAFWWMRIQTETRFSALQMMRNYYNGKINR